jgi:hypothetical protein
MLPHLSRLGFYIPGSITFPRRCVPYRENGATVAPEARRD